MVKGRCPAVTLLAHGGHVGVCGRRVASGAGGRGRLHEGLEEPALAKDLLVVQEDHSRGSLDVSIGLTPSTPFEEDAGKLVAVATDDNELGALQDAGPVGLLLSIDGRIHETLR